MVLVQVLLYLPQERFWSFRQLFFRVNHSGITLFDYLDREDFDRREVISMSDEKHSMSLGFECLGVLSVFVFPSVVALGVLGVVSLGVPMSHDKVSIWVPSKFLFWVSCGSMLTTIS